MICAKCDQDRRTVSYRLPQVDGLCCGVCRRKWKIQSDPAYAEDHRNRRKTDSKRFRDRNPDLVKSTRLKCAYGIDLATYEALVAKQDGRCAICTVATDLVVDHDHATGEIRGLLCSACNLMLGKAKDSPEVLERGVAYLRRLPSSS